MNDYIINHLFEFWEHIGFHNSFLHKKNGYTYTTPANKSWPNKIFNIDPKTINLEKLHLDIKNNKLPISLGIPENKSLETLLLQHNFIQTSIVKAMQLELLKEYKPKGNFTTITQVNTNKKAIEFAKIASLSFGYLILPETIISLVKKSKKARFYLEKRNELYVSCGIIYSDKANISGIHMIGTLPEYRGCGLGKNMTNKLLFEAFKNKSKEVVLVASKVGERVYSKLGFISKNSLKSYSIKTI